MHIKKSTLITILIIFGMLAKESEKWVDNKVEIIKIGNFALPLSQQPAPLFSFGQNLVDKGDFLVFGIFEQLKGPQLNFITAVPSILYGLTDKMSLFIEVPVAAKFMYQGTRSSGLEDVVVQLEQILYVQETPISVNEITIVGHISLPTGSLKKNPPTGFGGPTFFLGFTLSRTKTDWYYFGGLGGLITTFHKGTKFGNGFFYQGGVGRNIAYKTDKWLLNWLVEIDGVYRQRDTVCNAIECNSGGNIITVGPSIFFGTQRFEMDGGIAAVVDQHLFGSQSKSHFAAEFYAGWKF